MGQWVVLKFGGTSVSTRPRWDVILQVLQARIEEELRPLIVCSALSGVSNNLEALLEQAPKGHYAHILDEIEEKHRTLAREMGLEGDFDEILGAELETLGQMAMGASLIREVSPRLHARVMARGELMSTRLGAAYLKSKGLDIDWIDARQCLTSLQHPDIDQRRAFVSATCSYDRDEALLDAFEARSAAVLLTQGFIAKNTNGDTVLLGRGGSDTSATYLAARVGAQRCEIWTDVPGMFSANPRQVEDARLLRALDYDEAQEIASTGAKVLHPRCIAPVRHHGIPLHVRCTTRPELEGTIISHQSSDHGPHVKAISAKGRQTLVSMDTPGMWQQVGFLADIFTCFKRHGLSIDLVSTSEMNVTVSLDPASNDLSPQNIAKIREELERTCSVEIIGPCAAVSLVGRNIRGILHKLGPALEVFESHQIHLVSQAASDLNLTFVVDEDQASRLVQRIHLLTFEGASEGAVFGPTWASLFGKVHSAETTDRTPWWEERADALLALASDQTPLYVYDVNSLDEAASRLTAMTAVDRVFYAIKANPNPEILRRFFDHGIGFECVSPGELDHIFSLFPDIDTARVLYTPNFSPKADYEVGFERSVHVTLDNLFPLEEWPEVFRGQEIFVRVDPGQGKGHHEYVKTAGTRSKFGVSVTELDRLEVLVKGLGAKVVGLHAHTGSGILSAHEWSRTAVFLAQVAERFEDVRFLDLGGGLGVPETSAQQPLDLSMVDGSLRQFKQAHPEFELWLEPGRYLVAQAGVLLAKVTQLKGKGAQRYVGIDAGMNSLIRPALYGAFHEIVNLTRLNAPATEVANIVGPICESGDTLGYNRPIPPTEHGDVILIATAGAYGRAMSSNYNMRAPAQEVMVE